MSNIKTEFSKLSQFMQDLATRQLAQDPSSTIASHSLHLCESLPNVNDAAAQLFSSSSCDTSIGSVHSKQSQTSEISSSVISTESKASSTLRSPPPKRIRGSIILDQNDSMLVDPESLTDPTDHKTSIDTAVTFPGGTMTVSIIQHHQTPPQQSPTESNNPRLSNVTNPSSQLSNAPYKAPLDSHYTSPTGPAGAADE